MRKYFITILFCLLLAGSVAVLICPADRESILAENREPQVMPRFSVENVASGKFSAQFDEYVNDNIGFRGKLMSYSDKLRSYTGYTPEELGRVILTSSDIGTGEALEGRLVLYQNKIMEMFVEKPEVGQRYAAALNSIRAALPESTNMYSLIIPTQLEFSTSLYKDEQDSQKATIDAINQALDGVAPVDVYGKLAQHTDEYIYFKTDHHWTMDGAYYAYQALCEASGVFEMQKEQFTRKENGEFYGSLYEKAKSSLTEQEKDTAYYYDVAELNDISIKMRAEDGVTEYGIGSPVFHTEHHNYSMFFGGDNPLMEITNNSKPNGKTLMVLKDSYANALLPWLVNSYNKVVVIDPRSFKGNVLEEIKRYNPDDFAVINYVFSTTYADYCEMLASIAVK